MKLKRQQINWKEVKKNAEKWIRIQDKHKHKYFHYYIKAIETWLGDVYNYTMRKTWVPTAKINIQVDRKDIIKLFDVEPLDMVSVTFSNNLYIKFLTELDKMYKPYEVLLKYGFRGYSRGGKNGVFFIRRQDVNLISSIEKYLKRSTHQESIFYELGLLPEEYHLLKK